MESLPIKRMEFLSIKWSLNSLIQEGSKDVYTLNSKKVYPIKYEPNQKVNLLMTVRDYKIGDMKNITVEVKESFISQKVIKYSNNIENIGVLPGNLTMLKIQISLKELLNKTNAEINRNQYEATAVFRDVEEKKLGTEISLHIIEQKVLILLPGVMATELYINNNLCWPSLKEKITGNLELLKCNTDGEPSYQTSQLKVIEKPGVLGLGGGPYFISSWSSKLNANYPDLKKNEKKLDYLYLQEYPYDWRSKPEKIIAKLLGQPYKSKSVYLPLQNGKIDQRPSYSSEPSIQSILDYLKTQSPFFSDKVAVIGHSTGGVILNGLIRTRGVQDFVDKAFFIATPFYGAPKAYNAFLTGTMELGNVEPLILTPDTLKGLGPNLAVLYYLAPTKNYPNHVIQVTTAEGKPESYNRSQPPQASSPNEDLSAPTHWLMKIIYAKRQKGDTFLSNASQSWSRSLQTDADTYHQMCLDKEPLIPKKDCFVFYSDYKKERSPTTIGCISYNINTNKYEAQFVAGDGTVPEPSLRGNWGKENLIKVPSNLDHVAITNDLEMWKTISEKCQLQPTLVMHNQMNASYSIFPHSGSELNYALSNEPVLLNGMKVIFDQPVGVYPVTLESKNKEHPNGTRK